MKNFGFVICILMGGLIGYFIPHHQSLDFADKNIDTASLNKLAANPTVLKRILSEHKFEFDFPEDTISNTEAIGLIKGFRDQNSEDIELGGGMLGRAPATGSTTQELRGFVISRKAIDSIFNNDGKQKCTGLRIYLAKRPKSAPKARLFTFIVVGTKLNSSKLKYPESGGDILSPIVEHVDPCPENCGQLGE